MECSYVNESVTGHVEEFMISDAGISTAAP